MSEQELRPRLRRGARLRFDRQTGRYVLLSPERGLRLNESAAQILQQCTGERSVREIVSALRYDHPQATPSDVLELLRALERRGLVSFEASS
jgi:coenzyme PQQ biosynthesis protein PqqD